MSTALSSFAMKQRIKLNFNDRKPLIIRLRGHGFHLQEIGDAIGSSNSQVSHDLKRIKEEHYQLLEEIADDADEIKRRRITEERISIEQQLSDANSALELLGKLIGDEEE